MGSALRELAIFPLHAVLFPHGTIRLHVFEDRYRRMIRKCLDENEPFGVVLIREGEEIGDEVAQPYMVGTVARIVAVDVREDGSMDLQVTGEGRFRIRHLDDEPGFLVALVEGVYEHSVRAEDEPDADRIVHAVREEFEALVKRLFARQDFAVSLVLPKDPYVLSFTIAGLLPMANLDRQRLLETTDTIDRMRDLQPILRDHLLESAPGGLVQVEGDELRDWQSPN